MKFRLKHDPRKITDQDLIDDLQRIGSICGGKVKQRDYKDLGKFGVNTLIRRFGGWNAALLF